MLGSIDKQKNNNIHRILGNSTMPLHPWTRTRARLCSSWLQGGIS